MGQQPNIELEMADLPRPTPHPAPARRWSADRPGELGSPEDVPWGGAYGTPGPDSGYAIKLVKALDLSSIDPDDRRDVRAALAAVASARASHFGRAPVKQDVEVAMLILGVDRGDLPPEATEQLARDRATWLQKTGPRPEQVRSLVTAIPMESLVATTDELRRRISAGERIAAW